MILAGLATLGMLLDLFFFTCVVFFYGAATLGALSNDSLKVEPVPVSWVCRQLGLLCAIFGFGLAMRDLALVGALLIAIGYLLPKQMQSEPHPVLDLALLSTAAFSLFTLGALRWIA